MATFIRSVDGKVVIEIEPGSPATLLPNISDQGLQAQIDALRTEIRTYRGQPVVVTDSADMEDELTIYLYMGSQEGFNANHWYYYDGTEWVDGGEYVANPVLIDDTLTQSGEAADAKATGDEITAIKADLTYNKSVIDDISNEELTVMTGTDQSGKAINYNAEIIDAVSSWHIITYSVNPEDAFRITASAVSGGYWYIFTDGTNVVAKSNKSPGSGATITNEFVITPELATTLIINYSPAYNNGSVLKIIGHSVNGISELDARVDIIEDILVDVTETASATSSDWTVHENHYMYTSGAESSETTLWDYYEYPIPSIATGLIVTANAGQSAPLWILKNISGTVLGYSSDTSATTKKTETINLSAYTGAVKLFVNDKKSGNIAIQYQYTAKRVDGNDVVWDGVTVDEIISANPLWGKIICCAGDSITYGADMDAEGITDVSNIDVYQSDSSGNFTKKSSGFLKTWNWQIASRNKMTLYNAGVSGSTMQGISDKSGFSLANGRYTKLPGNIDYLLIWFGWNDNAYGTLGTISDDTNETYFGAYNVVLPYLIDKYPYAKIGLIVPYGSSAGHREAVRLLGNKWGVAVWDNYQGGTPLYYGKEDSVGVNTNIVTENRAKFQANGAHPNYKGHKQLADMIEDWMKGI